MIGRIGLGMGDDIVKIFFNAMLLLVALTIGCATHAGTPVLAIWDDAVIGDDFDLSRHEVAQFIYSNVKLKAGDKFTALVSMEPGYRVLCCVQVVSESFISIVDLAKKYPKDINFVKRLHSMKGVQYAYAASFVTENEMNPAMRRLAKGSGDTYYSAPALLGTTRERNLDSDTFLWDDWGRVTLKFKMTKSRVEQYRLDGLGTSVSVAVEALPD